MSQAFINRIKSFCWRLVVAVGIFALNWISENITGLGLPNYIAGILALIVAEITKQLNKNHQIKVGKLKSNNQQNMDDENKIPNGDKETPESQAEETPESEAPEGEAEGESSDESSEE